MATAYGSPPRKMPRYLHFAGFDPTSMVDPDFDTDANEEELTGVGLDHLHQGNAVETSLPI
jgi:hypothetical protein